MNFMMHKVNQKITYKQHLLVLLMFGKVVFYSQAFLLSRNILASARMHIFALQLQIKMQTFDLKGRNADFGTPAFNPPGRSIGLPMSKHWTSGVRAWTSELQRWTPEVHIPDFRSPYTGLQKSVV